MTNLTIGFIVGSLFGTFMGILLMGLCSAAARADRHIQRRQEAVKLYRGVSTRLGSSVYVYEGQSERLLPHPNGHSCVFEWDPLSIGAQSLAMALLTDAIDSDAANTHYATFARQVVDNFSPVAFSITDLEIVHWVQVQEEAEGE